MNETEYSFDSAEGVLNLAREGLIPAKFRYTDNTLKRAWREGEIATEEDYQRIVEHQRWKVGQIQAAVAWGAEIDLSPSEALKYVQFVKGNPTMSAEGMRAKALGAGHEIVIDHASSEKVTASARRKGSDRWSTITWTIDDAKRAGLLGDRADNQWAKYPMAMLLARATSQLCRVVFPDTLKAFTYDPEEMGALEAADRPARALREAPAPAGEPSRGPDTAKPAKPGLPAAPTSPRPQPEARDDDPRPAEDPSAAPVEAPGEAHPDAPPPAQEADEVPPPPPPESADADPAAPPEAPDGEPKADTPWRHIRPKNKAERVDYMEQIRGLLLELGVFDPAYYEEKMRARFETTELAKLKVDDLNALLGSWERKTAQVGASKNVDWDGDIIGFLCDPVLGPEERRQLRDLSGEGARRKAWEARQ